MHLPTVRIVSPVTPGNPHGYVVINEADLTPEMTLHGAVAAAPEPEPETPAARRRK